MGKLMHLHQHQHVTFTGGKHVPSKVCELKSVNTKEIAANYITFFSKCKINYNPMFYVFTNVIFYVGTVILYCFPNNVHQLAYNKLLELAPLIIFIQNSTSAQQAYRFTASH